MSLTEATLPDGRPVALPGDPPFAAVLLNPLRGVPFSLPCDDAWITGPRVDQHAYLDGAIQGWEQYPEWMDFLDPGSPGRDLKAAERDLYLHWWSPTLEGARRILDVGCGVGRFATWFLDQGLDVWGVDADLESLRRCAWHAADRAGRLDLHWSSVHRLPDVRVDIAVAAEVLCYTPRPAEALEAMVERLVPGGRVWLSVEARWGWAAAQDAPSLGIDEALDGTGVLHVPGDRWVHTYEEHEVRDLLEFAGLEVEVLVGTHYLTDGPLEGCIPEAVSLERLVAIEERCRVHPVWGPLNRAWTAVARKA